MSKSITHTNGANRATVYNEIIPQIKALIQDETDLIANLANVSAVLKDCFGFFWVGFYLVKRNQLVLGPFQGSLACTRISKGKGVCGTAWEKAQTILVPNVDLFKGHIACNSFSRSEIVVPIFHKSEVTGVLDIDSDHLNDFDQTDALHLEKICNLLSESIVKNNQLSD